MKTFQSFTASLASRWPLPNEHKEYGNVDA